MPSFSVHTLFFETFIHPLCIRSPKQMPQRVRFNGFALKSWYLFSFLKLSSSCLCLLLRLPVTSSFSYICSPITCFRRQFLSNMWPIQLAVLLLCSCLCLLLRLPVTSTFSYICPPITYFRRQFLRNMWPIQLAVIIYFIIRKKSLFSLTLWNTSSFLSRSVKMISILLEHHTSKHSRYIWPIFRKISLSAP
jgi:hypothetical protein